MRCRAFIDKIYDFQRQGLTESFKQVDKTLSSVLLTPEAQPGIDVPGSASGSIHDSLSRRGDVASKERRKHSRSPSLITPGSRGQSRNGGFSAFEIDDQ